MPADESSLTRFCSFPTRHPRRVQPWPILSGPAHPLFFHLACTSYLTVPRISSEKYLSFLSPKSTQHALFGQPFPPKLPVSVTSSRGPKTASLPRDTRRAPGRDIESPPISTRSQVQNSIHPQAWTVHPSRTGSRRPSAGRSGGSPSLRTSTRRPVNGGPAFHRHTPLGPPLSRILAPTSKARY